MAGGTKELDGLRLGRKSISALISLLETKPESTEGRPWGQPLKKAAGAPLNLG